MSWIFFLVSTQEYDNYEHDLGVKIIFNDKYMHYDFTFQPKLCIKYSRVLIFWSNWDWWNNHKHWNGFWMWNSSFGSKIIWNTSDQSIKWAQKACKFILNKTHFGSIQYIKWLRRVIPRNVNAIDLTQWKLDWAVSVLHNSRRVGIADLLDMWSHPNPSEPVAYRGRVGFGVFKPPPPKFVPNSTRLWKLLKIAEFRTPTHQDVGKKCGKILKLPRFAIVLH